VRVNFGHGEKESLWSIVAMNCLMGEAFAEFMYVSFHILT